MTGLVVEDDSRAHGYLCDIIPRGDTGPSPVNNATLRGEAESLARLSMDVNDLRPRAIGRDRTSPAESSRRILSVHYIK